MSTSKKRNRALFTDDREDPSESQVRSSKAKKSKTWDTNNLFSKDYVTLPSVTAATATHTSRDIATPGISAKKRKRHEKDIYDFSSSEPEELQQTQKRNRKSSSSSKKTALTSTVTENAPIQKSIHRSLLRKGEALDQGVISSKKLRASASGKSEERNGKIDSKVTLKVKEKTTVVVEIPSSHSARTSKRNRTNKIVKQAKISNAPEPNKSKRDPNQGEKAVTPPNQKRSDRVGSKLNVTANRPASPVTSQDLVLNKSTSAYSKSKSKKAPSELSNESNPSPQGTITSKKIKILGPKKNVFTDGNKDIDFGFKDLPITAVDKKKNQEPQATSCGTTSTIGTDDTACEVCGRYDSKKKNPMLLCDGCDFGYHIKCIGLSKEPQTEEWFCRNCDSKVVEERKDGFTPLELSNRLLDIPNFELHLKYQQRNILDKLTGKTPLRLKGLEDEIQKVNQVVQQTILAGEGNSMLIIGSRGTGKTALVNNVISNISDQHRDSFHVVRLNGFIHTDDKIALREIWRQLGREMQVEDDLSGRPNNYADILVSLLALLSDPNEMSTETESNQNSTTTATVTTTTSKSVIFILDEFDHFTTHHRQTLLYNLFEIAQSKKAPILVLGLTTKVDVVERLEKRVKSRFSHRYILISFPRSLPAFWDICKEGLTTDETHENGRSIHKNISGYKEFMLFWQSMIEDLYAKDADFMRHIQAIFYQTKSVPTFLNSCIIPISRLSPQNHLLLGETLIQSGIGGVLSISEPDSKLHLLQGLSELELALLIAAARLDVILDTDTCNFDMAYEEYSSLSSRHKIQTSSTGLAAIGANVAKVWGRPVALDAWENLVQYELLVPVTIATGGDFLGTRSNHCGVVNRKWKLDISLEEIPCSVDGLSSVMTKWCREI
ncbi:Origin recognition complex subunit 4 [Golovinomyces cichoracearum]|uniref:Origin recognition complex subunit 4 n=1 Tax=Golovinomyces cichoracearum TaxID=62708 RepID=A0A420J4Y8_9PEZI|nr:Origin recognition complex subunit 4 [Golovinomyces cichoracearum]